VAERNWPASLLLAVPQGWGRSTVLGGLAEAVSVEDVPVTIVVPIEGRELSGGAGQQAQMLCDLLTAVLKPRSNGAPRASELLGVDSVAGRVQTGLAVASLFVSGLAAGVGFLLAGMAVGAVGKVWDDSPAGQDGALAKAARAVAAVSVSVPVLVLVDDADCLDTDLATTLLESLACRSDGQVLAVIAGNPDGALARMLAKNAPYGLTGRVHRAEADPDMSSHSRSALARELCPWLPDVAISRIGQRTQTFADVFRVVASGRLAEVRPGDDEDGIVAASDAAINARLERGEPSAEAVILAWAGGVVHVRQAARALAVLGAEPLADDVDVERFESLIRVADLQSLRLAAQVQDLSVSIRRAMAAAVLDEAAAIAADPQAELVDRIVAWQAVHRVRLDVDEGGQGRLARSQCDLVAGLESLGDLAAARDAAASALAGCPDDDRYRECREALAAAVLRLAGSGSAQAPDPLAEKLIAAAVADGAAVGLEARIWAAVSLLAMPSRRETGLGLVDQITADLGARSDLGPVAARWRLLLAFHTGRAGYSPVTQQLLSPLLTCGDPSVEDSARRVLHAGEGPQADVRLQIAVLEAELDTSQLSDDDLLRLHHALGRGYAKLGDYRHALNHAQLELPLCLLQQGPAHPRTLLTRHSVASWTGHAGDPAVAQDLYAALLPDIARVLGPVHPDTLATRHELADWTGWAGDPAAARDQFAALLPDIARVLGRAHRDTLATRHNLANWTGKAGDPAAARDEYAALLPDIVRVLGPAHPDTLLTRHNLASFTGEAGDPAAARDQYAALLPDFERVLGPAHPRTLLTRHSLANWTGNAGDPGAARDRYAALLPDIARVLGPAHPDTLATRSNLATWTGEAGDSAAARDQLAGLLPVRERVLGPAHPDTLATRNNLAYWTEQAN